MRRKTRLILWTEHFYAFYSQISATNRYKREQINRTRREREREKKKEAFKSNSENEWNCMEKNVAILNIEQITWCKWRWRIISLFH